METKDFGLASLLVTYEVKMISYKMDRFNEMWFEFEDSDVTKSLKHGFDTGQATANVQRYIAAQKMLKSIIYSNRKYLTHRINGNNL